MKNIRINETKVPYFFITFYNLNPLFGLFSSFEVLLTLSFFEFLKLHSKPFKYRHTVNAQPEFSFLLRISLYDGYC